jgi:hypothetical protein
MEDVKVNCPYCGDEAKLEDSSKIYRGRSYGPAWICRKYPVCDAYVGCHPGTEKPLGRLADRDLRAAKMKAHSALDPHWRRKVDLCGWRKSGARKWAYRKLAKEMGISEDECHVGMFDVEQCARVIAICSKW